MPRRSEAEKEESRARILEAAAGLFRKQGIEKTSVAQVMEQAGMTHGGFYRHFSSKEDLVAASIPVAFRTGLRQFTDGQAGTAREAEAYVKHYLSADHAESLSGGCPITLLGAEIARGSEEWQRALKAGVVTASTKLQQGLEFEDEREALALLSTLVGSVVLARAVGEGDMRDKILEAANSSAAKLF